MKRINGMKNYNELIMELIGDKKELSRKQLLSRIFKAHDSRRYAHIDLVNLSDKLLKEFDGASTVMWLKPLEYKR